MSLATMIQRRGSTATIRRATRTATAGGSTNHAWADASTGVKVLLDVPEAEVAQRLFGQDVRCDLRAIVLPDVDLREKDGVSITAGWRAGEHYEVVKKADFDQGRNHAHFELALVRRPGAFT
jgi:hypothetical protein